MAALFPTYRYRVDAADRIAWVDAGWLAFAAENGAPELGDESILGRPLWDFVSGQEPRRLYAELHARLRRGAHSAVLPFRCDSPTLQRHMRLTITPGGEGALHYESVLLRVRTQPPVAVIDSEQPRATSQLTMCSCCKRALLEPVGWVAVEEISTRIRLVAAQQCPQLRYTICPNCARDFRDPSPHGGAP